MDLKLSESGLEEHCFEEKLESTSAERTCTLMRERLEALDLPEPEDVVGGIDQCTD